MVESFIFMDFIVSFKMMFKFYCFQAFKFVDTKRRLICTFEKVCVKV